MKTLFKCNMGSDSCKNLGLLILRILPSYFLFANHGLGKITDPGKWNWLGSTITKYFFGFLDFTNPLFGFLAAFSESICAIFVFIGLFTRYASALISFTMIVAILYHITGTGGSESACLYFSIFMAIFCTGPGKFSIDMLLLKKNN